MLLVKTIRRAAIAVMCGALPATAAAQQAKPIDPANIDTACAACQNFFQHANGGWIARNEIPGDRPLWGSFSELQDQNFAALREVLTDAAAGAGTARDPNLRKLGLFYGSCMDSTRVEREGLRPIQDELRRIDAMRTPADVQAEIARLQHQQVDVGFAFRSRPDAKRSQRTIAEIAQAGLSLPDRDYYVKTDSTSEATRRAFVDHVSRILRLAGGDSATAAGEAARVMALETALARASMTQEAQRDPEAVYHLTSAAELQRATPAMAWDAYFSARRLPKPVQLNVAQPRFLAAVDSLLTGTPVATWRDYLRWRLLATAAPALSTPFVQESFRFNGTVLQGVKEMRPRWRRCLVATDNAMGEILGQAFVRKHFTKWRDYSALEIGDAPYVTNQFAANRFESRRDLAKVGRRTDRTEWGMTPPTVNASYNPSYNAITFPAGIMQPPFFDPRADDAVNYGGMGAVIGHEITHGFDDEGRQFDADGNLSGWWDSTDAAAFNRRTAVLERQASDYVAVDTLRVNGKLTLGENIADLGGLLIAYGAWERSLRGKPAPAKIDGLTGDQRFFLAWAQIWRTRIRPEFARMLVTVDPHGPAAFRVNGPMSNMPAFAKAFGCKPGDPMVREDSARVQIW